MNIRRLCLVALVVLLGLTSTLPAAANTRAGMPVFFPETGHTLGYTFREFYDRQGGTPVFGLPLSEVFLEDGRPVQYFERARFEWHANLLQVQAGHLGRWAARERMNEAPFQPQTGATAGAVFFPETGQALAGSFLNFWRSNGGLPTFGYPISAEFREVNAQNGQTYSVQYFERARFEYHPQQPPGARVLLGHLGREYLAAHPAPVAALQPVSSAAAAWEGLRPTAISVPRIGVNTRIVTTGFSYGEWEVPRHTAAFYWPVSAVPGTGGNIVVAGHVGYRGVIFNQLPNVRNGDEVFLMVGTQSHRYIVQEVLTLLPSETWVMNPTGSEVLTLITCVPIGVYSHRLIVRATPAPE